LKQTASLSINLLFLK